jgi:LysR family transcriptional regulator (chromosome initiation inhibitor)
VCSPTFFARYFGAGVTRESLRRAPCIDFNPKDELQKRFVRRITRAQIDAPSHWIPHVAGFLRACVTGLGWGMCPERMIASHLARGELVELTPSRGLDVDLYWQSWRLSIGWLDEFGAMLKDRSTHWLDQRRGG